MTRAKKGSEVEFEKDRTAEYYTNQYMLLICGILLQGRRKQPLGLSNASLFHLILRQFSFDIASFSPGGSYSDQINSKKSGNIDLLAF